MLSRIRIFLVKFAISVALKRKAPKQIPLSGIERLRERNYYSVVLREERTQARFRVESVKKQGLEGYWFEFGSHGQEASLPNQNIKRLHLEIKHYAYELEITHRTGIDFLMACLTFKPQREVLWYRFKVWVFSKKKLPREDRMEVLAWAYEWTLHSEDRKPAFTPQSFLIHKHGDLIMRHPEKDRLMKYYRILFESLVASGDFEDIKSLWSFALLPNALATLDKYEEDDRRHADNLRQQKILGWLTFALVLIGVGQILASFFGSE
ncbi:hypothetical protein [Celeribacter litoreus]|uniref:hypothetical protein n=1 Tax=Celeribacter litoreus TaxID=2876714 RepID=UPI001CCD6C13|nr:hypothetical protein [Celeribacter litoreus]MCA0044126.1 hypothetical protein [Celeribacter litoreus]